jgi:hypothetical protein
MDQPVNPYESPIIPEESPTTDEPVGFTANFVMDEAGLLASARIKIAPIPRWFGLTVLIGLAAMYFGLAVVFGATASFAVGAATLIGLTLLQGLRDRVAAYRTLQLLRAHPVLGALGRWRLSIDRNEYFLETPGGRQHFTIADTSLIAEDDHRLLIWFGEHLPIVIPKNRAHPTIIRHVKRWIEQR